ncbi:HutD/Ves family protein [Thauera phenylacetica]
MKHLPRDERVARPWKNGGGTTREVAVSPQGAGLDDFAWRVSLAELHEAGAFSSYPGVSRTLLLLEGEPVRLDIDGEAVELVRGGEAVHFDGGARVFATPAGVALDAGVMSRDARCRQHSRLATLRGDGVLRRTAAEGLLLLVEGDPLRVRTSSGEEARLGRHDALRFGPGDAVEVQFSSAGATRVLFAEFALPGEAGAGDRGGASG